MGSVAWLCFILCQEVCLCTYVYMKLRICMYGFVRMYVSVNHINPPNIRTFLKKIKSFSNNNRNFLEKITSFFKNVLIFYRYRNSVNCYFVEVHLFHMHFWNEKVWKYPALYQTGILYKKEYIVDSKRIMRKSALKYSEGMRA